MSSVSESNIAKPSHAQASSSELGFVLIFSTALFSSALLLFLIQPLVGKALLPKLGGTPQVWTTCMVFFQAMLFAGYLHAHYTSAVIGIRKQAVLHFSLAVLALFALPIAFDSISGEANTANPIAWLITALLVVVGAPMFIISTTAPLLQKWVAHTGHPVARDPYFLYAASNAGSLLALLVYPTIVEPNFNLSQQTWMWSIGYGGLVGALGICLWLFKRNYRTPQVHEDVAETQTAISNATRVRWLLLSFAPSSLMLGVTTYISTDVAAVPLFWIVPLALYLLTFILVFSRRQLLSQHVALRVQAFLLALLIVTLFSPALRSPVIAFPVHLLAFFFTALVCHGELAHSRPHSRDLTEFYLWLSLGGVLGGVFNALLAPVFFDRLFEYPLVLIIACLLRPAPASSERHQKILDMVLPLVLVAFIAGSMRALSGYADATVNFLGTSVLLMVAGLAALNFTARSLRLAVVTGAAYFWLLWGHSAGNLGNLLLTDRSFFGVHKVYSKESSGLNVFMHGTTIHGAQFRDPRRATEPLTYYHRNGPFGDLFRALRPSLNGKPVGIVGLGAGAIACYGDSGDEWTYYEIDPLVEAIARDPAYFTYLRDCSPTINVVIGDARLTMRKAPDGKYGLIVVDAFNSDAIPTHLLTKEAIEGYLAKLAPNGVLALHISNRHLNLAPVVGNVAASLGLAGKFKKSGDGETPIANAAELAVLARSEKDLGPIATDPSWTSLTPNPLDRVWSDDYINILAALRVLH